MKYISFEGCIGAGKTTLVDFFSAELRLAKIVEHSYQNPFINDFYSGKNVKLETELTFLSQHFSLVKNSISKNGVILADFSIEKDLVFARMNLNPSEFLIFNEVYNFVIHSIGIPDLVIYLDLEPETLLHRMSKRGRIHEANIGPIYFENYSELLKQYFTYETKSRTIFFDVEQLAIDPRDEKILEIKEIIKSVILLAKI